MNKPQSPISFQLRTCVLSAKDFEMNKLDPNDKFMVGKLSLGLRLQTNFH
jgi:hypothetical protein